MLILKSKPIEAVLKKIHLNLPVTILLLILLFSCSVENKDSHVIDYEVVNNMAKEESLLPVRPGVPNKNLFWNKYSRQFIYAPSFEIFYEDAVRFEFSAIGSDSVTHSFISENSHEAISSIWDKLPVGFVKLTISGINSENEVIDDPEIFEFYKAAYFKGPYKPKVSDYKTSAERALEYEFNQAHIQNWAETGTPDISSYNLYCYPSKIIGAVIESMLQYSKLSKKNHDRALQIATNAADYLIGVSEKKGAPLEFFPPTYEGDQRTSKAYRDQFMTIYPAHTAMVYLDLFDTTGDDAYKEAALNIANTYKNIREPSGTWKLKLWVDGTPVNENDCIPIGIINFFDRLESQYGIKEYLEVRNDAYNWIVNNSLQTFNWSGQFEDIAPVEPYKNLSKDEASAFALYIFNNESENQDYLQLADDLLRFCEDQFVIWEKPMPQKQYDVDVWITPCVLEQYSCYEPINASAANMIEAYLAGYKAVNNKLYLAKAVELANAVTFAQHSDTGRYPTYWQLNERMDPSSGYIDWLNCTSYCARVMLKMADNLE